MNRFQRSMLVGLLACAPLSALGDSWPETNVRRALDYLYNRINAIEGTNRVWLIDSGGGLLTSSNDYHNHVGWVRLTSNTLYVALDPRYVRHAPFNYVSNVTKWTANSWSNSTARRITAADTNRWTWAVRDWTNSIARRIHAADTQRWTWAANTWSNSTARHITAVATQQWNWTKNAWSNSIARQITAVDTQSWVWVRNSWSNSVARRITAGNTNDWYWTVRTWSNSIARQITAVDTQSWVWARNSWSNSVARQITIPNTNSWTVAATNWLAVRASLVPYSGAIGNVDLGTHTLTAAKLLASILTNVTGIGAASIMDTIRIANPIQLAPGAALLADNLDSSSGGSIRVQRNLAMGQNIITNYGAPVSSHDVVDLNWVTNRIAPLVPLTGLYQEGVSPWAWGGWRTAYGNTTNNIGSFIGYSEGSDSLRSGWAWYSTMTALQDKIANGFCAAPFAAKKIGTNGIVCMVMCSGVSVSTNYVDFELGRAGNVANIYSCTSTKANTNQWTAYRLTGAQLPSAWTNAVPVFTNYINGITISLRGIPVEADFYTKSGQKIMARVLVDWD